MSIPEEFFQMSNVIFCCDYGEQRNVKQHLLRFESAVAEYRKLTSVPVAKRVPLCGNSKQHIDSVSIAK